MYCSLQDVHDRLQARDLGDELNDTTVGQAIAVAEATIDRHCGYSFEAKAFTATPMWLASGITRLLDEEHRIILHPRSITHLNGVPVDNPAGFAFAATGICERLTAAEVQGTAGVSVLPQPIRLATIMLASQIITDSRSRISQRASRVQNQDGTVDFYPVASTRDDLPTSLPEVNSILARYRHKSIPVR